MGAFVVVQVRQWYCVPSAAAPYVFSPNFTSYCTRSVGAVGLASLTPRSAVITA